MDEATDDEVEQIPDHVPVVQLSKTSESETIKEGDKITCENKKYKQGTVGEKANMATKDLGNTDRKRSLENLDTADTENRGEELVIKDDCLTDFVNTGDGREQKIFKPADHTTQTDNGKPVEMSTSPGKTDETTTSLSKPCTKPKKETPKQLSLINVNSVSLPSPDYSHKDWAQNGAKPKHIGKPSTGVAGADESQDYPDSPYYRLLSEDSSTNDEPRRVGTSKKERRYRKSGKKKNGSTSSQLSPDTLILLTNENGVERELKSNQNGGYTIKHGYQRSVSNVSHRHNTSGTTSKTTSLSEDTSHAVTIETTSEDSEKVNSLLLQQELYKQRKVKPFQKMTKLKTGEFEVGIEGDAKRSLVKCFVILPDKNIIVYDRNNKCLKLFNKDFDPLDKINIGVRFCSLAPIFIRSVVGTLPETKQLKVFHITPDTNKILPDQTLPVHEELYSVAHFDDMLFVLQRIRKPSFTDMDEWQIKRLDLNHNMENLELLRTVCPGHKDCTLFANDQGLYFTNKVENEILQMKHDGQIINRHKVSLVNLGIYHL